MRACGLCGRKFKNERGLMVHLARTHDIHGARGRLSLKAVYHFFPSLEERRWSYAQKFLNKVEGAEDEWIEGYVQALNGMLIALKESHSSPEPYILQMKRYSGQKLQNLKEDFATLSNKPVNTTFDKGYIQAWIDYVSQHQSKAKSSDSAKRGA
ncbi:MAG: hypothetical protein OEZ29_05730 [Candidatus Bathyarchaeota archaeon]|nr:hypothetical protein [Candidatus Bathyarchaeota archaeon]